MCSLLAELIINRNCSFRCVDDNFVKLQTDFNILFVIFFIVCVVFFFCHMIVNFRIVLTISDNEI